MEQNNFEKVHRDVQTTLVCNISKSYEKEISKRSRFFVFQKYINRSTPKLHQLSIEIASKKYIKTTSIFYPPKSSRKKYKEIQPFFAQQNYVEKSTSKRCWFFTHQNYVKQSTSKRSRFFAHLNYVQRSTSKHLHGRSELDFSPIEITPNKLRRNVVDFSPIKIASTKYVKMMWAFADIFFLMYRRNIDIKSKLIQCGVSARQILCRLRNRFFLTVEFSICYNYLCLCWFLRNSPLLFYTYYWQIYWHRISWKLTLRILLDKKGHKMTSGMWSRDVCWNFFTMFAVS